MENVPEFDPEFEYLYGWLHELIGRSGTGFGVVNPLSYPVIEAWARLRDIKLQPYEVQALIYLDDVFRNPKPPKDQEEQSQTRVQRSWPKRKVDSGSSNSGSSS